MRKIKGFSYDPEKDKDIIEHLDRQQNMSVYIKELVRKDMKNGSIEEIVRNQIEKYLQEHEITAGMKVNNVNLDADEIQNILNL